MIHVVDYAIAGGLTLGGLVVGAWWGQRRFWALIMRDRRLGQAAAEKLALRHGLKIELYDLGGG